MNNKFSWKNFKLLPKKQQRAVYTLAFSLLGFLLVVVISALLMFGGGKKNPDSSSSSSESGSGSGSNSAVVDDPLSSDEFEGIKLEETENTDKNYLKETLFVGDSNTERLMEYGAISIDNFVGKSGLSITGAGSEKCVYFKNDTNSYTIPQAVAKMKPRRVVVTLGTNDSGEGMTTEAFLKSYESFVKSIQEAYPHCDVIINSIPPVAKQRSYKNIDMDKINDFNKALANMAKDKGYKFLNSSEALRGTDGYGKATYFAKDDGIHLVQAGARAMVDYARTHPFVAEDRRPDTNDIPTRRPAPSTTSSAPDSSSEPEKDFTATYDVKVQDGKAMGYLKSDKKFDNKTSYTHTFNEENKSFTVTAVANEGFVFEGWSDGVKEAKRTDETPKKSFKVTANFRKIVPLSLKIDQESTINKYVGDTVKFTATINGDGGDAKKIVWKNADKTVSASGTSGVTSTYSYKFDKEGEFKISASYEGVKDAVTITIKVTTKVDPINIVITGPETAKAGDSTITYTAEVSGTGAKIEDVQWTIDGAAAGTGKSVVYTPPGDLTEDKRVSIVAKLGAVTRTKTLVVSKKEVVIPTTISILASATSITVGESVTLTAEVAGTGADASKVSWSTGGTGKTTTYTPTTAGRIEITATVNGVTSKSVWVEVKEKPNTDITINIEGPTEGALGATVEFKASTNGDEKQIVWYVDGNSTSVLGSIYKTDFGGHGGKYEIYAIISGVQSKSIIYTVLAATT